MSRIVFSLLGRPLTVGAGGARVVSRYRQAVYDFGPEATTPHAVFVVALLAHLRAARKSPDRVVVFGTSESAWGALLELLDEPNGGEIPALWESLWARDSSETENAGAIRPLQTDLIELGDALGRKLGLSVVCHEIRTLTTNDEQSRFVDDLRMYLERDDTIVADVTHALGHQRVLLAQTLVALEPVLGVSIESVFSGALDLTGGNPVRTPVVRLDGVLSTSRLERASLHFRSTGDPGAFEPLLPTGSPIRKALRDLSESIRLAQPDRIAARATALTRALEAVESSPLFETVRAAVSGIAHGLAGPLAVQQFRTSEAALARGDLLRASLALREACVTVACIALGKDVAGAGRTDANADAGEWLNQHVGDPWREVACIRNALAHGTTPTLEIIRKAFDAGTERVRGLLASHLRSLRATLKVACASAF